MSDSGLQKAIEAAGSRARLAAALGIKPPAISQWKELPLHHVREVERLFGIPKHVLRPDWFDKPAIIARTAKK